ncbi:hypothetical protein D9M71_140100 [compost metagenome]
MEVHGQLQLRFEQGLLAFTVQCLDVIIQAELTHCTHLPMALEAGQPVAQFGQVLGPVFIEVHRMQTECGVQLWVALYQVPHPLPVVLEHPQHHQALDTLGPGVGQYGRPIGREIRKVQVGMGVDQPHVRPRKCAA